jgi:hypothetical protein
MWIFSLPLRKFATALIGMFMIAGNVIAETKAPRTVAQASKPFVVFDNMFYAHKPDLAGAGLIRSSVIYPHTEWKAAIAAGQLPDEASFKNAVKDRAAGCPGPVVIDIEYVYLSQTHHATDAEVKKHFRLFITLAKWAREAAPGHLVGYYGHGLFPEEPGAEYAAETKELVAAVDAFFPSLYTFGNKTPEQWKEKLQALMSKAHQIAPGKPVYPYLWAQYHEGPAKALEYLDGDLMKFELETARDCGADGVVMWSSSRFPWKDGPWCKELLKFVAEKPVCKSSVND